jgi:transposase-like protein
MDHDNDDSVLDLEARPIVCPKCGARMRLFWMATNKQNRDRHRFECPSCKSDLDILVVRDPPQIADQYA